MDSKLARAWLTDNGYRVKPKGRIPSDLLAIYQAKVLKKNAQRSVAADSVRTDIASGADTSANSDIPSGRVKKVKRSSCGFCTVNAAHQHKHCPGTINQGKMGLWTCLCYEKEHTLYVSHL